LKDPRTFNKKKESKPIAEAEKPNEDSKSVDKKVYRDVSDANLKDPRTFNKEKKQAVKNEEITPPPKDMKKKHEPKAIFDTMT
jgi:hypothetical protein